MARRSKAQWRELFEATSSFVELVPPSNKAIESHSKMVQLRVIELELPLDSLVDVLDPLRR